MGVYKILFYGGIVLAIIFLILAVVLFFTLNIPKVFGIISGRTHKKAIEEIRNEGAGTKRKKRAASDVSVRKGTVSTKSDLLMEESEKKAASSSGAVESSMDAMFAGNDDSEMETEMLGVKPVKIGDDGDTEILGHEKSSRDTSVLEDDSETAILGSEGSDDDAATDVLSSGSDDIDEDDDGETAVLTADGKRAPKRKPSEDSEQTDVLTNKKVMEGDDAETAVLTDEEGSTVSEDIVGRYSPEETAVLKSEDNDDSGRKIRIISSETVVHTNESLV